jgi:hypothetical protein
MEEDLKKELEELRAYKEKTTPFLRAVLAEKIGFIPFICGMAGEKDQNNMQDTVFICPAYGSDVVYVYRKESVSAPGW